MTACHAAPAASSPDRQPAGVSARRARAASRASVESPLISRSIASMASIHFTASIASGAFSIASLKKFFRPCAQQAASRIGPAGGRARTAVRSRNTHQPAGCQRSRRGNSLDARRADRASRSRPAVGGSGPPKGRSSRTTVHNRPIRVLPRASTGTGVSSGC